MALQVRDRPEQRDYVDVQRARQGADAAHLRVRRAHGLPRLHGDLQAQANAERLGRCAMNRLTHCLIDVFSDCAV